MLNYDIEIFKCYGLRNSRPERMKARDFKELDDTGVVLTIDGEEYVGYLHSVWYEEAHTGDRGWEIKGSFNANFEVDNDTLNEYDLKTHNVELFADMYLHGMGQMKAHAWTPVEDDGFILEEKWTELGVVESIEPHGDSGE